MPNQVPYASHWRQAVKESTKELIRISKPATAMKAPTYDRVSKPANSLTTASIKELAYDHKLASRPKKSQIGAPTPLTAATYGRVSQPASKATMKEPIYDRISKPAVTKGPADDSDREIVGRLSNELEDDTLEKEAAMSSPLKGSELRMEAKVCYHNIAQNEYHIA